MNNTFLIRKCVGENCNTFSVSGNNIIIPVLFGVAIGFLIAKAIK